MEYEIIKSKRKTVAIYITKDVKVTVKAPFFVSDKKISEIVDVKKGWIEKKLLQMKLLNENKENFSFEEGQKLLYLGNAYPIKKTPLSNTFLFDGNHFIISDLPFKQTEKLAANWYKQRAKEIIFDRVVFYSAQTGIKISGKKITSAKTVWGSCSGKNAICFSFRLMFAPKEAIDYVVIM
jgi:predicted metal-dependent hydrolase